MTRSTEIFICKPSGAVENQYINRKRQHWKSRQPKFTGSNPVANPALLEEYKRGELLPTYIREFQTGHDHHIHPDRRGVSQFWTYCQAGVQEDIESCIKRISEFVLDIKRLPIAPLKITALISSLFHREIDGYGFKKMHWHINYDRADYIAIIKKHHYLNISIDDMNATQLLELFEIIDVFKYMYSKHGYKERKEKIEEVDDAKIEENTELIETITKHGFAPCQNKLRIVKPIDDVTQIQSELLATIKLARDIYIGNEDGFREMRFGIDLEKSQCFLETNKALFFQIYRKDIKGFLRALDMKMDIKYLKWVSKLNNDIEQPRMKELLVYCTKYFETHPQIFKWYQSV